MAVRKIIRMGHPTLRRVARDVKPDEIDSDVIHHLVVDMIDTLHDYGGIGLAAPQVNEPVRLAVVEIAGGPTRYGDVDKLALTVFVNPRVKILNTATAGYWEGCLSVPGLRGFVERPQHVKVTSTNLRGEKQSHEFEGFLATVFQHELDHLDGKLYIDHITDTTKLVFDAEYDRYVLPLEEA